MIPEIKNDSKTKKLELRFKQLVEEAYNFKHTNSSISDLSAYKAMLILRKINRIKFGY